MIFEKATESSLESQKNDKASFISITCVSYVLHMPWRQSTLYFVPLSKKGQHQMEPKSDKCD